MRREMALVPSAGVEPPFSQFRSTNCSTMSRLQRLSLRMLMPKWPKLKLGHWLLGLDYFLNLVKKFQQLKKTQWIVCAKVYTWLMWTLLLNVVKWSCLLSRNPRVADSNPASSRATFELGLRLSLEVWIPSNLFLNLPTRPVFCLF